MTALSRASLSPAEHLALGVPARVCDACGEYLPHACAPEITMIRQQWTGRRIVTIRDRQPEMSAA